MIAEWQSFKWHTDARYYNAYLQPNLLGGFSVIKCWGGRQNKLGNFKMEHYDSYEDAIEQMDKIKKQRKYKKYQMQEGSSEFCQVV